MVPALRDEERVFFDLVDEPVFLIDPAGPVSCQPETQRFRLTDADVGIALNGLDQVVDLAVHLAVGFQPVEIILPAMFGEADLHSIRSRGVALPASIWAMALASRAALAGLRRRCAVSSSAR